MNVRALWVSELYCNIKTSLILGVKEIKNNFQYFCLAQTKPHTSCLAPKPSAHVWLENRFLQAPSAPAIARHVIAFLRPGGGLCKRCSVWEGLLPGYEGAYCQSQLLQQLKQLHRQRRSRNQTLPMISSIAVYKYRIQPHTYIPRLWVTFIV